MSAHHHYAFLPGRKCKAHMLECDGINRDYATEAWQVDIICQVSNSFVHGSEYLTVWRDKLGGGWFFAEHGDEVEIMLYEVDHEYDGSDPSDRYSYAFNKLYKLYPEKLEQMCHYIMGWQPDVWDYDKKEREQAVEALRAAMAETTKEQE